MENWGKKIINLSPALLQNSEFIVYIQIIFAQLITYIINIIFLYSTACERLKCEISTPFVKFKYYENTISKKMLGKYVTNFTWFIDRIKETGCIPIKMTPNSSTQILLETKKNYKWSCKKLKNHRNKKAKASSETGNRCKKRSKTN